MRHRTRESVASLAVLCLMIGCARKSAPPPAQSGGQTPKSGPAMPGGAMLPQGSATDSPLLGKPAGDFSLEDSKGQKTSLDDLRKSGNVILMFYKGVW